MNETSQSDEPCSGPSGVAPLVDNRAVDTDLSTVDETAYSVEILTHNEDAMPRKRKRKGSSESEESSSDI